MEKIRTREEIIQEIIEVFVGDEELFNECLEYLDGWNGYLGDDRWYDMEEIDVFLEDKKAEDLLNMTYFGKDEDGDTTFNPLRDFFKFNVYGNLVSTDFKKYSKWYLTEETVEEMLNARYDIYSIEDNFELSELFDELEKLEEGETDD